MGQGNGPGWAEAHMTIPPGCAGGYHRRLSLEMLVALSVSNWTVETP